jgi:hypothetical protein
VLFQPVPEVLLFIEPCGESNMAKSNMTENEDTNALYQRPRSHWHHKTFSRAAGENISAPLHSQSWLAGSSLTLAVQTIGNGLRINRLP